eukprot:5106179-Amphidinium_carterae.1
MEILKTPGCHVGQRCAAPCVQGCAGQRSLNLALEDWSASEQRQTAFIAKGVLASKCAQTEGLGVIRHVLLVAA